MTFAESVSYCLTNYFTVSGRGSRSEYWWFILFTILAGVVAIVIDVFIGRQIVDPIVSLALLVPSICAAARRLHDTDRSGWWQLLVIVPLIGAILLLVWLASAGTPGRNRFGPAPGTLG